MNGRVSQPIKRLLIARGCQQHMPALIYMVYATPAIGGEFNFALQVILGLIAHEFASESRVATGGIRSAFNTQFLLSVDRFASLLLLT
jgi:hypothetical protein